MSPLPDKLWLRWGDVVSYLTDAGMNRKMVLKLKASGTLAPKFFPGQARAYYDREDVLKIKPEAKTETTAETRRRGEQNKPIFQNPTAAINTQTQ